MSVWLRRALSLLALVGLVALAHGSILRAGFLAPDQEILVRASGPIATGAQADVGHSASPDGPDGTGELAPLWTLTPRELFAVQRDGGWLVSGLSLAASRRLWGLPGADGRAPLGYRLENLALLALCAVGLHRFLRRMLMPWIGTDQTAAASRAAAAFLFVHPLGAATVSSLAARADLLALAFVFWSAAAFLRGRQDRKFVLTALAFVGVFLAALSGELGFFGPLLLVLSEFLSSHRYRKKRDRLRTSSTTLLVFGGAALLAASLRTTVTGAPPAPGWIASLSAFESPERVAEIALYAVEKLGVLVLPSNALATGITGTALAGLVFLFAMQPGLVAARSAPRLWGWLLFAWLAVLSVASARGAEVRVDPESLGASGVLFTASAVMCVGLGIAVTSVSGIARHVRPAVVAVGFAVLAHGNAGPWVEAGDWVTELRHDLVQARERHGRDAWLLVIDPLEPVAGVDPLGDALAFVLDPLFTGESRSPDAVGRGADERTPRVQAITEPGFLALARERELERMRANELLVVFPTGDRSAGRSSRMLSASDAQSSAGRGPRSWRREPRSPDLDLDALTVDALRVTAPVGSDTSAATEVTWRARSPLAVPLTADGVWWRQSPAPEATFDLSASLAWRLSGRVRRIWFERGLTTLGEAELLDELPGFASGSGRVEPEALDDDWYFRLDPPTPLAGDIAATRSRGAWRVGLLDLASLEYVEREGAVLPSGTIRFPGAAERVRAFVKKTGGPVAWHLDYRVDGVAVARASGRRIGRLGSREE
jgi:hypothetical protein